MNPQQPEQTPSYPPRIPQPEPIRPGVAPSSSQPIAQAPTTLTSVAQQPMIVSPEQPTIASSTYMPISNQKYGNRITVIAIVTIVLGALSAASFLLTDMSSHNSYINLALALAQILIGVGLYHRNKIAYVIFNVIAALAVISSVLSLGGLLFALAILPGVFALSPLLGLLAAIKILLIFGTGAFCLFAIIWLHPKPIRQLLH